MAMLQSPRDESTSVTEAVINGSAGMESPGKVVFELMDKFPITGGVESVSFTRIGDVTDAMLAIEPKDFAGAGVETGCDGVGVFVVTIPPVYDPKIPRFWYSV